MSELRVERLTMPAARLGPPDPLPPLRSFESLHGTMRFHDSVSEEDRAYFGYGFDVGALPYRLQSDYDRNRAPRAFSCIVLENDYLRAEFLPGVGGRLWGLTDKQSGRELLYRNPVFQPCNLAIRNAWVSGGVEWNMAVPGHSVFTVAPVFAARVENGCPYPVLRLYEWQRTRCVPFLIDVHLPDASPFLYVYVRIVNPNENEIPMYWWSNAAVVEADDVRVLAPAERAFLHDYVGGIRLAPLPEINGIDRSYPANAMRGGDFYFRIPKERRPWVAAVDGAGKGMIHASTERLSGRKLFTWGRGPGGLRWQDFLTEPGYPYIEIQGGLTHTQGQCVPMPAGATWDWVEAYGSLEADPRILHGKDWNAAWKEVGRTLDGMLPADVLSGQLETCRAVADGAPDEILSLGSGWGAVEQQRRRSAGREPFGPSGAVFDECSITDEQQPWLCLLDKGELPGRMPSKPPGAYMIQPEWHAILESALAAGRGDHWLSWLHVGVMRYSAKDHDGAREAWLRSVEREPNGWAYRNLAILARNGGRFAEAVDRIEKARSLLPELGSLAIEFCRLLLHAHREADLLPALERMPGPVRRLGRVRIYEIVARIRVDDLDAVAEMLHERFEMSDVREGEGLLTQAWFAMHARRIVRDEGVLLDDRLYERVAKEYPCPPELDFRVHGTRRSRGDVKNWRFVLGLDDS